MAHPSELKWTEFYLPDGLKAAFAIDGQEIKMMVDDDQIPHGMSAQERLDECYSHYFSYLHHS